MEKELEKFLKSIIFHFTEKVQHNFTISIDSIELELLSDKNWEEIDFRALNSICKEETHKFIGLLEWANFDKSFLISSIPIERRVKVKWFKNGL